MNLEIETDKFLVAIEDAGAMPSKPLVEQGGVNVQAYLSPDYSTRVYVRVDEPIITRSTALHILHKLKLSHLAAAMFS